MWYVCSKLTPLWLDRTCLCFTTIISLSKTKFTVLAATFHLERLGASFTMNIKMQWKESEPTSEPHVASVICALLMHESGPGLYTQVRWCRWTFRSCWTFGTVYKGNTGNLLQWLHQAPCSYSGVSWTWNQSKGSPKGPQVSAHLDALCFSPYQQFNDIPYPSLPHYTQKSAPSPLSRLGGGGHISSDWQQQQLRLRGVRTAANSRWPRHMNPPFHNLNLNLTQRSGKNRNDAKTLESYRRWQYFLLIQNHLQPDTAILLLGATHTTVQI